MKRFHLHVSVKDLDESVRFYSTLFSGPPTVRHADYAEWIIEDPRINFAISTNRQPVGVNHLGFQVDSDDELRGMHAQLAAADSRLIGETDQPCCYARADKYWVTDPTGMRGRPFTRLAAFPSTVKLPWSSITAHPTSLIDKDQEHDRQGLQSDAHRIGPFFNSLLGPILNVERRPLVGSF